MAILSNSTTMGALLGTTAVVCILATALGGSASAAPTDQTVFEDFELINANDFTIGTGDATVRFTGGFSGVVGIPELYNSGTHAWMVNPGDTGQIEFETNAALVEFFTRPRSTADGTSVLTAFDDQDVQVGDSVTLNPGDPFQLISFTGPIRRIEFTNNADSTCSNCMNAIDDFGFSPVPSITLSVSVNQASFSTGETLSLDIEASNPGLATDVDVYMVILLPDGDGLVYFTDLDATTAFGSLSNLADVVPMVSSLNLASSFSANLSGFFAFNWTGVEPIGDYTAFFVMALAGSLTDGIIDEGDIVKVRSAGFSFNP